MRRATNINSSVTTADKISIHALLAESDGLSYFYIIKITDFYPRSPCGERRFSAGRESDTEEFLSTLSLRRATQTIPASSIINTISIHALLAESDKFLITKTAVIINFYPRSPCGERPRYMCSVCGNLNFYPRSPCGERRRRSVKLFRQNYISIHALLAESDRAL